ncbi:MAG: hypothetical protein K0R92_537 [Lachnospiraceae bacterium]|jgi:hypothetical protein|nr:hypothetical protein [Lachnospiraceae bacterium]
MGFQKDCKHPFKITCKFKMYGMRGCEIRLESGENLSYMPIPEDVRFSFASIERFYITDAGQKIISDKLDEINKLKDKYMISN